MKIIPLFAALLCTTHAYAACGTTFCSINTHWDTQGLVNDDTLRVDLRYSYAKADTFRGGSSKIPSELPSGSDEEIESMRTINQVLDLFLVLPCFVFKSRPR